LGCKKAKTTPCSVRESYGCNGECKYTYLADLKYIFKATQVLTASENAFKSAKILVVPPKKGIGTLQKIFF
jgi:hypothetical protein